ncbi:MAG: phosphotransferase [Pseudomonadota bacterium]
MFGSDSATERLLRTVPRFAGATRLSWRPLHGGQTNRSVRVDADGEAFAVRQSAPRRPGDPRLPLEREWQLLHSLSARFLAPEPVWHDAEAGLLVTRFQAGTVWTAKRLRDPAHRSALVALLRRVHAVDAPLPAFAPVAAAERYWAHYCTVAKPAPTAAAAWQRFLRERERLGAALELHHVCHNDVMYSNLIGDPPLLLDWEFAARSDPLFDLATVAVYHDFDEAACAALLLAYTGRRDASERERLALLCRLCRYVSGFWQLARRGRESVSGEGAIALPAAPL